MGAVKSLFGEENSEKEEMAKPTLEEVLEFIKSKKLWNERFCKYYAERFWNHYEASGWIRSGNIKIKKWKNCFNSQWQRLKFKEDIEYLNECNKLKPVMKVETDYLNTLLNQYKFRFDSVPKEKLVEAYDYMKERKLIVLTQDEKELMKKLYSDKPFEGKAACVTIIFSKMVNYGRCF